MEQATGTINDVHDHGHLLGIDFTGDDGRDAAFVADRADTLVVASIMGALAHGDRVAMRHEPIAPRLGAPRGRVVSISILDHTPEVELDLAA